MNRFEHILSIQDELDVELVSGTITYSQYAAEWEKLLRMFGYTQSDYAAAIDARWDNEATPDTYMN